MTTELIGALVFLPLLAALACVVLPRHARLLGMLAVLALPVVLVPLTASGLGLEPIELALGGWAVPLGIGWRVDALSLLLLWTHAIVALAASVAAWHGAHGASARFWPTWLLLITGLNAALVSADWFNLYVALELITLCAVALAALDDSAAALRAAMRYLVLGMLGSLMYLLGVGLVYAQTGSLAMAAPSSGMSLSVTAQALILTGLLVKAAIFPLHVWLPAAHGHAPGPVSAMLSAVVVKIAILACWRLWFQSGPGLPPAALANLLGLLGVAAMLYGSIMALVQRRLKMVVAYSTVAQLGLLLLLFPLAGELAFKGAGFHLLTHALAKAAMFLAAANVLVALGTDRIHRLPGLDSRLPIETFTLALAGVTLMGLPPSGGFAAKWMLLQAAWQSANLFWLVALLVGGLLSAAYIFRVLAMTCFHPRPAGCPRRCDRPPLASSLAALALALGGLLIGLWPAPVLRLLEAGLPGVLQ
ncbi:MAG: complex I subunit 5 family protein [Wenzhouxiangellaceae bacterium]